MTVSVGLFFFYACGGVVSSATILGLNMAEKNGVEGETVVLLPGLANARNRVLMQWKKGKNIIFQIKNNTITIKDPEGRFSMNKETGSITINTARKSDAGEYTFENFVSSSKTILHVYEKIVSVSVESQVSDGSNNSTCNVTLRCIVNGSREMLSWSRDHQEIIEMRGRDTVTVIPSRGAEVYSCTASNPISSQTASVVVNLCQPYVPQGFKLYRLIGIGSGLGLMVILIITLLCCLVTKWRGKVTQEEERVYAEIEDFSKEPQKAAPSGALTIYEMVGISQPHAV
ncbi:SLAM family member 5-like [Arapaima gigas]